MKRPEPWFENFFNISKESEEAMPYAIYFFSAGGFHSPRTAPLIPPGEVKDILVNPIKVTNVSPALKIRAGGRRALEILGT